MRAIFLGGPPPPPFFEGIGPALPDYDVVSLDDEQVKGLMHTLGIGYLMQAPAHRPPVTRTGCCDSHLYKSHPTHWLMFQRFHGFPDAKDNGFTLHGWLKSRHTQEDFARYVEQHWRQGDGDLENAIITHPDDPTETN